MNKLLFFCISSALLLFSVIVVNILPPTEGWYDQACNSIADDQKYLEQKSLQDLGGITQAVKDEVIDIYKRNKNMCKRKKAMAVLQYIAFNLNIIFGFICAFLGFLMYFDIKNIEVTGLIGLGCGVIGFVLTLVYVIESGLVFNDIDGEYDLRIDSDGAVLELKDNAYKCIFYDKNDKFALFRRFSDYGNKFLNYKKEVVHRGEDKNYEYSQCTFSISSSGPNYGYDPSSSYSGPGSGYNPNPISGSNLGLGTLGNEYHVNTLFSYNEYCKDLEEKKSYTKKEYSDGSTKLGDCKKLYGFGSYPGYDNKHYYDFWITSIILSCFILLLNIGVAIFGFLLFNSSGKTNL